MAETNAISQGEYFNQLRELNKMITYLSLQMRNTDLQPLDVVLRNGLIDIAHFGRRSTDSIVVSVILRLLCSLNTSIARAITISVPLIPNNTKLRDILEDITEHQLDHGDCHNSVVFTTF